MVQLLFSDLISLLKLIRCLDLKGNHYTVYIKGVDEKWRFFDL